MQRPQIYTARRLRRELTLPEVLLWEQLRAQKTGLKFRRQHPVGHYVADFCCLSAKLIIEINGEAHNRADGPKRDAARDAFLQSQGFEVVRLAAKDVLENMDGVVTMIRSRADSPLRPLQGHLPASGEELV